VQKVILDTDILSEFLKGFDQNVVTAGTRYAEEHKRLTFTSVTVFEIIRGLEQKSAVVQVKKVLAWMAENEQVVPTAEDYLSAALVIARAKLKGRTLELPDCLIAAVASRLGLPLVTGNVNHYLAIRDAGLVLEIENWRESQS